MDTKLPQVAGVSVRAEYILMSIGIGLGMGFGYYFWYGYHVPSIRRRDAFYAKLERERAAALQG